MFHPRSEKTTTAFEAQDVILTKARSDLEVAEFTGRTEKAELVEKTKRSPDLGAKSDGTWATMSYKEELRFFEGPWGKE